MPGRPLIYIVKSYGVGRRTKVNSINLLFPMTIFSFVLIHLATNFKANLKKEKARPAPSLRTSFLGSKIQLLHKLTQYNPTDKCSLSQTSTYFAMCLNSLNLNSSRMEEWVNQILMVFRNEKNQFIILSKNIRGVPLKTKIVLSMSQIYRYGEWELTYVAS